MGEQVRFPLSGDVSQWFEFLRNFNSGGQIGLFNVELGESSDPTLEHKLVDKVGSYGKQIGQLTDAVAVLLKLVDKSKLASLDEADTKALAKFAAQAEQVARTKRDHAIERGDPAAMRAALDLED